MPRSRRTRGYFGRGSGWRAINFTHYIDFATPGPGFSVGIPLCSSAVVDRMSWQFVFSPP